MKSFLSKKPPFSKPSKLLLIFLLTSGFLLLSSQRAVAAPVVNTLPTDMVFATQAQLFGELVSLGGASEVIVGFVYDTQYHASAVDYAYYGDHSGFMQTPLMSSPGSFTATMPASGNLFPSTIYHYRAVTKNSGTRVITAQGEDMTFTTDAVDEPRWKSPTGHIEGVWQNEARTYDENLYNDCLVTISGQTLYSDWLYLTHDPIDSDGVRFTSTMEPVVESFMEIEVYKSETGVWERVYFGSWERNRWRGSSFSHGTVTQARFRFVRDAQYAGSETIAAISEVDFREYVACTDTAPSPPLTLSSPANGSTGQSTSPTVSWNTVSGWGTNCAGNTNTYQVFLHSDQNLVQNSDPTASQGTVAAGTTSKSISGLSNGITYYWKVRASNGALSTDSAVWSFTTAALPCLERSPSTLTFSATAGGSNPSAQNINISNSGGGTLSWASSDDQNSPNWLLTTDASLTSTVSINISGLSAGTYTGTVTLSCNPLGSCQAGACQQKTTAVTLTVNPAPVPAISRSPTSLTFTSICEGATSTESKTFEVWNSGDSGTTLNWSLSESASWFGVAPTSGTSTGEHDTVTVALVNTSSLAAGAYTSDITISDPNASNSPQTVSVSLTVNTKPCLERSPSSLTFTATAGGSNPSSQNINISNSGVCSLSWASSDNQTWMNTTDASSTSTVSINISGLTAGTYTGTVTLSCNPLGSCQAGACQQKTTAVTLTVNAAPVPAISRDPSSLTFTAITQGTSSTESKTFQVWNSGGSGSTLNWSLNESASWFGVSPTTGTSTGSSDKKTVTVTLENTSSLSAGTYTANIAISDPNASNTPQTVSVSLTVNALPCLERSPSSLTFSATAGGSNPSAQNINISNSGGGTLSWASSDDRNSPNWLLTTDASSTSTVSINISGLTAGTYTGTVTLSCNPLGSCQTGACQQKTTAVTLTVQQAMGSISGCVWLDTNGVCPADGAPDVGRANAVEISATGYPTQTAGTGPTGCYTFSSVPYTPGGTVYTVRVNKPVGEEDEWSYACAGGFSGQGSKDVTLDTGTSAWTVDFSIVNVRPGWFQVIDGDIHSEGDIENNVP